jgi:hypothetical protein
MPNRVTTILNAANIVREEMAKPNPGDGWENAAPLLEKVNALNAAVQLPDPEYHWFPDNDEAWTGKMGEFFGTVNADGTWKVFVNRDHPIIRACELRDPLVAKAQVEKALAFLVAASETEK